jgi:1-acyl-sn-glycerol-3-phosphate acyltransferase
MELKTIPVSAFAKDYDFEDIRPYYNHEAREAMFRLIENPVFFKLVNYLWPQMTLQEVQSKADKVNTNLDFQLQFMHEAIRDIVANTAEDLTCSGFENLDKKEAYLFIANHRDILLDSAILQVLLVENGFSTSEITFGNNLMESGFITEFGRLNRMFTVQREGTSKELYEISKKLSAYIRHTIVDKKTSVWIAQRNGRTKDGFDTTQTGLLKMLNISGIEGFENNYRQLKIVPVTISYEYEPCDVLKVRELYLSSLHTKYKKAPEEDLNSIITGIKQQKGRIHLAVGTPIVNELSALEEISNDNEKTKRLTSFIDKQIYTNYRLWPVNYIAADLLNKTDIYKKHYTEVEKNNFINTVSTSLSGLGALDNDAESMKHLFLKLYANPLLSKSIFKQ